MSLPIGIVGGGAFGRALALASARRGRSVVLVSRTPRDLSGGGRLPIRTTAVSSDLSGCELIFIAVPTVYVEAVARDVGKHLDGSHLIVHISRGLVGDELTTVSELIRHVTPVRRVGALAGPLVADALAEGQPGGGIVGALFPEVVEVVRESLGGPNMRIYSTEDIVGVELASAFVGMVAVALGFGAAAGFGPATLSVLATRAMAEAARIGQRRGASPKTFAGLAGTGDLVAAVAGDGRPELGLGRALFAGTPLDQASHGLIGYVEAIGAARRVLDYADRHGLETPMAAALIRLAQGSAPQDAVLGELMNRPVGRE